MKTVLPRSYLSLPFFGFKDMIGIKELREIPEGVSKCYAQCAQAE